MKLKDAVILWNEEDGKFKIVSREQASEYPYRHNQIYPCSHGAVWTDWGEWIKDKEYFPYLLLFILYDSAKYCKDNPQYKDLSIIDVLKECSKIDEFQKQESDFIYNRPELSRQQ